MAIRFHFTGWGQCAPTGEQVVQVKIRNGEPGFTEFMRQGGAIYQLQKILGHSTITQTEKYAHFAADYLKNETKRVSFSAPAMGSVSFITAMS